MAASPQVVTTQPEYLNARTGIYTAQDLRKPKDDILAPGVQDINSFKVVQRALGLDRSVDVSATGVFNKAYVRGSTVTDQGLYRIDATGLWNLDIAASDPTNPRIDSIYLCVEDQQHIGSNNQATVRVVTGTPTGGATLDNRTGAGAAPASMSSELLADILMPALGTNVPTANIRDRRRVGNFGTVPWLGAVGNQVDMVCFQPAPGQAVNGAGGNNVSGNSLNAAIGFDNMQAAALMWLPRRIVGATRMRWKYLQGSTPIATQYVLFIADASGRVLVNSGAQSFIGAANNGQDGTVIVGPWTLEAGWYYVGIGLAALTASSLLYYNGCVTGSSTGANTLGPAYRNIAFRSATGGLTVPTTLSAFTDSLTLTGITQAPMVPICALSIG